MKTIHKVSELPTTEHYAILVEDTYSQAGYDLGDPSTSVPYVVYKVVDNLEELQREVTNLATGSSGWYKKNFKVVKVTPVETTVEVMIRVKT